MKKAETITKVGIEAMMKTSKPGMYEYQYKAEFDYALAQRGVLSPGFPSIISSGKNNFKIHYYDYRGQAQDGDMILNDVGAVWDYEINDVSRAFRAMEDLMTVRNCFMSAFTILQNICSVH